VQQLETLIVSSFRFQVSGSRIESGSLSEYVETQNCLEFQVFPFRAAT